MQVRLHQQSIYSIANLVPNYSKWHKECVKNDTLSYFLIRM